MVSATTAPGRARSGRSTPRARGRGWTVCSGAAPWRGEPAGVCAGRLVRVTGGVGVVGTVVLLRCGAERGARSGWVSISSPPAWGALGPGVGAGTPQWRGEPAPRTRGGRRAELLEAAVGVVAESGLRGLTHRAVDARAGLPEGTCSAYLRTRGALLVALAEHVGGMLARDVDAMTAAAVGHADDPDALAADVTGCSWAGCAAPRSCAPRPSSPSRPTAGPSCMDVFDPWRQGLDRVVEGLVERIGRPDPGCAPRRRRRDRGRARDGDPDGGAAAHGIRRGGRAARRPRAPRRRLSATRSPPRVRGRGRAPDLRWPSR